MVAWKHYLQRVLSLPPQQTARKAVRLIKEVLRERHAAARERRQPTYLHVEDARQLARRLFIEAKDIPDDLKAALPPIADRYLAHQFDLLGSAWVETGYGAENAGFEGHKYPTGPRVDADIDGRWLSRIINASNTKWAARAWQLVSEAAYRPIDWHRDPRSGYRWSASERFNQQPIGFPPGADIKWPWELARMQHLPQLAVAALLASSGGAGWRAASEYVGEVRNVIIDFYCANPPRFGPNWTCPMEVGIRAANWVVALDIAGNTGWEPDEPFRRLVIDSLYDHARHILHHLEWSESGLSNHYLSDIVGLLFIAAYLPPTPETEAWLAFSASEIVGEIERQFHPDGGNYEGSTSYHRLSGELAIFGSALIAGLAHEGRPAFVAFDATKLTGVRPPIPSSPLPRFDVGIQCPVTPAAVQRLNGIPFFTRAVLRPDNRIVQIGDTDSGRLFKLHPVWGAGNEEDLIDHRHLIAAADALFDRSIDGSRWLDAQVVRSLMKGQAFSNPSRPVKSSVGTSSEFQTAIGRLASLPPHAKRELSVPLAKLPHERTLASFPDFGLHVIKGKDFFLALRCVETYRVDAPTGHLHDDNLAIELFADGRLLISDPGTYVYTSLPDARNAYRSANAHHAPRAEGWDVTAMDPSLLFQCPKARTAHLLYAGVDGFAAEATGRNGECLIRAIQIGAQTITISDGVERGTLRPLSAPPPYSNGYGKQVGQSPGPTILP